MRNNGKVIWKEGMFLQPQHFQQMERYILNNVNVSISNHFPYAYGITEFRLHGAPDDFPTASFLISQRKIKLPPPVLLLSI
jgi:hypothetical protein